MGSPWPGVFCTDIDSARVYDRHWHTTFGFGVMERGAHRSMSGRGIVDAAPGDIITTNPGEVHDGRPLGAASRRWRMIYLEDTAMAAFAGGGERAIHVRLTQPVFRDAALLPAVQRVLLVIERWNAMPTPDAALACEEALARACGLLLETHSTSTPPVRARADLVRVRDRLADDFGHTPSLAELAKIAGLSRYQVLRRFEHVYGVTPLRWQRQARVERARTLIQSGSGLAQAAADSGFADQSHMTRVFFSHFGFTPGVWADSVRTGRPGRLHLQPCSRQPDSSDR
jgi:AraC-like DNA-binding protein